jgi:hypothetical protein
MPLPIAVAFLVGILFPPAGLDAQFAWDSGIQRNIDTAAVRAALDIARASDRVDTRRFHEQYRIRLGDPSLRQLEVVTEFRRVVLQAEERLRLRDMGWGPRQAAAALRPFRGLVTLRLHIDFSPQNVLITIPAYDLLIHARPDDPGPAGPISPVGTRRLRQHVSGQSPPGSPMTGAIVEATFDSRRLDPRASYLVGVYLEGNEIERIPLDLAALR